MVADTGKFLYMGEQFLSSPMDPKFTPKLIATAVWNGFLPMGTSRQPIVLLKLHKNRTLLAPENVHVGKKSRRAASKFRLSIDEAFADVVKAIQEHTYTHVPGDNWLTDELVGMYLAVNQLPENVRKGVRFHSVELWEKASGRLVAGEVGYIVGGIYSSCTGFALKKEFPGAGTLQLVALGKWLHRCGFKVWDLGMGMDYKFELGGKEFPRDHWVACVRQLRGRSVELRYPPVSSSVKDALASLSEDGEKMAEAPSEPEKGALNQPGRASPVRLVDEAALHKIKAEQADKAVSIQSGRMSQRRPSGCRQQ